MPANESRDDLPTHPSGADPGGFDPDDADADPRLRDRSQFSEVLAANGYQDALVLARERVDGLDRRHVRILRYLQGNSPPSVRALAAALDEDKGTVSRALGSLADLGAVELRTDGRAKRPVLAHDHVVVEPLV